MMAPHIWPCPVKQKKRSIISTIISVVPDAYFQLNKQIPDKQAKLQDDDRSNR